MKHNKPLISAILLLMVAMTSHDASAHISYINLKTATGHVTTTNPDGSITYTNHSVALSNGGWADATDADWGNSHYIVQWFKFNVTNPSGALVDLAVVGDSSDRYNALGVVTSSGGMTPAFSLYSGLLPDLAHDDSVLHASDGKEGAVQALADTTMGTGVGDVWGYDTLGNEVLFAHDEGTVDTVVHYLAPAGELDGGATSVGRNEYSLASGWYTLMVGGSCYLCQVPDPEDYDFNDPAQEALFLAREEDSNHSMGYNVSLTITSVPLPTAFWMFGAGLLGMASTARRKR